jgi:transcription initiation factor TFIIIB Brf1 subunit/transcription initiation factor TFIIB
VIEDHEQGNRICGNCACVIEHIMEEVYEKRTFEQDAGKSKEDPGRVGVVDSTLLDVEFSTTLESGSEFSKIQNAEALSSSQRSLLTAHGKIQELGGRLHLAQNVVDLACDFYKRVHDDKQIKHRKLLAFCAACVREASKREGVLKTFDELSNMTGLMKTEISKCVTKIKKRKLLKEKGKKNKKRKHQLHIPLIKKNYQSLKFSNEMQQATEYAETQRARHNLLAGKQPKTVCAALTWFVCCSFNHQNIVSKNDILRTFGVAANTLDDAYAELDKHADQLRRE